MCLSFANANSKTSIIAELSEAGRLQFKASLGYMRPYMKKINKTQNKHLPHKSWVLIPRIYIKASQVSQSFSVPAPTVRRWQAGRREFRAGQLAWLM